MLMMIIYLPTNFYWNHLPSPSPPVVRDKVIPVSNKMPFLYHNVADDPSAGQSVMGCPAVFILLCNHS